MYNLRNPAYIVCPSCACRNRIKSRFCRKCGTDIKDLSSKTSDIACEKKSSEEPVSENHSTIKIKDAVAFLTKLKDYHKITLEELNGLINYQQYLFDISNKGLALINKDTGRFITVNSQFEEFTGYSKDDLKPLTFPCFLTTLNKKNKEYDMPSLPEKGEFFIFNGDFRRFSVKIRENSGLFENNSLFVIMESRETELNWLKKDRTASVTKKLFLVARIAEEISSSLDFNMILNNTLDRISAVTKSDASLIMFMDENKVLLPIASKGISDTIINKLTEKPVRADAGSRARALTLGKTVEAKLKGKSGELSMTGALIEGEKLSTMVTVPLKAKDEIIGIMTLGRRKKESYTGKEMELLDTIVSHIVIAIKHARLYEQVKSQLKELEVKNKKLEELEQIKKKLTGMIVHDLKNPLTAIMSYTDYYMMRQTIKDKELLKTFNAIHSNSQDILSMVINLLDISKMEDGKPELKISSIDLEEILKEALEKLNIKIEQKKIKMEILMTHALPELKADKNLLYRVIVNLLDNGIKHSPPESTISINITADNEENNILFCINDEGDGIPEEYHEKIFEAFFTLDTEDKIIKTATGIGLSFCKLAVEAHGGRIWVENCETKGCKFYFTLPA